MRNELAKLYGRRAVFTATIGRFGKKPGFGPRPNPIPTVLLKDICDEQDNLLTDHLWVEYGISLQRLDVREQDRIRFNARVTGYNKGVDGNGFDYRLSYPTKISKVCT
jgi:hypothetical protein